MAKQKDTLIKSITYYDKNLSGEQSICHGMTNEEIPKIINSLKLGEDDFIRADGMKSMFPADTVSFNVVTMELHTISTGDDACDAFNLLTVDGEIDSVAATRSVKYEYGRLYVYDENNTDITDSCIVKTYGRDDVSYAIHGKRVPVYIEFDKTITLPSPTGYIVIGETHCDFDFRELRFYENTYSDNDARYAFIRECAWKDRTYYYGCYTEEEISRLVLPVNLGGEGYIPIASEDELALVMGGFATCTVGAGTIWEGPYTPSATSSYIQVRDISLTGAWTPKGTTETPFGGVYDGGGHSIYGLTIAPGAEYSGLFGVIDSDIMAGVKNLNLVGVSIACAGGAGAIAGKIISDIVSGNAIIIENCMVSGKISSTTATNQGVGGLIGEMDGATDNAISIIVRDCISHINVNSQSTSGGSLIGAASRVTIATCVATGGISGSEADILSPIVASGTGNTISDCYYDSDTAVHDEDPTGVTPLPTLELIDLLVGNQWANRENKYPILRIFGERPPNYPPVYGGIVDEVYYQTPMLQCRIPIFNVSAGTYNAAQTVTITCDTSGASIYYTTNGDTPTSGSTLYSAPVSIAVSATLKAIAIKTGYTNSAVASAAYVLKVSTPTGLAATIYSDIRIDLTWDTVSGADSYILDRAKDSGFTDTLVSVVSIATNSYSSTGLAANTQYYFRVRAVKAEWTTSENSSSVNKTTYTTEAQAYFDAMQVASGVQPSDVAKTAINKFILDCKAIVITGSVTAWDRIAHLMLFVKTGHTLNARINMKNPGVPHEITGTIAFTDNGGYACNGTGYIVTDINFSTNSIFTQNSALLGAWLTAIVALNTLDIGARTALGDAMSYIAFANTSSASRPFLNTNTQTESTNFATGLCCVDRPGANEVKLYNNGSQLGSTLTNASVAPANLLAYVMAANNNNGGTFPCRHTWAMSIMGGSMGTKHAEFYAAAAALMTSLGVI